MNAEVGGIKKNIETVLLAELFLIKNINIVNAPKETKKIWCPIAIKNVCEKLIYGFAKKIIIKTNKKIKFNLLYDQSRSLQKKIKIEQLRKETS